MEEVVKATRELLQDEIKGVLQSDLAQAFLARLEVNQKVSAQNVDSGVDAERLKRQVKRLKGIGEKAEVGLTNLATKPGAITQGFLGASNVAGSGLHQGIYAVGKFIGFNFKPWQAVNLAKNIGNAAKFLGPIVSGLSLAADVYEVAQEEERDKNLADARRQITSQFIAMSKDLESQVEQQLREVEAQVYGEIEKQIAESRQQEEEAIVSSNTWIKELSEIRQNFEFILGYISRVT